MIPKQPATAAGRRMLHELPTYIDGRSGGTHWPLHSILAIEAEAAHEPQGLDVRWFTEWRVHPKQDGWSSLECATEQEANDWTDRHMRGSVVIESRVVRADRTITRHEARSAPSPSAPTGEEES